MAVDKKAEREINDALDAVIEGIMRDRMSRAIEGAPQTPTELASTMRMIMSDLASRLEIMSLTGQKPTEIWPAARTILAIHEWLDATKIGDQGTIKARRISKVDLKRASEAIRAARGIYGDD